MEDFDIDSAVEDVSSGLGIEITQPEPDTPEDTQAGGSSSEPAQTPADAESAKDAPANPAAKPSNGIPPAPKPGEQSPAPTATGTPLKVPASWRPEAKAEFDKLPPVVQAEVVKREEDILRGIGEYKAAATFGTAVDKALQPFSSTMRQYGIDPVRHIGQLFDVHQRLALGSPEVKQATLAQLARDFNITLQPTQPAEDDVFIDPEVKNLRTQVEQLQSLHQQLVNQQTLREQQQLREREFQVRQSLQSELNTFAADPEHAFFDEVASDMAILIQSGRAPSLKQAYELAIRMSPAILEKENLRISAKEASKKMGTTAAAAAKTTAARTATGVNVKSQPSAKASKASPGARLENLDMSIEAAFDQIMASNKG